MLGLLTKFHKLRPSHSLDIAIIPKATKNIHCCHLLILHSTKQYLNTCCIVLQDILI